MTVIENKTNNTILTMLSISTRISDSVKKDLQIDFQMNFQNDRRLLISFNNVKSSIDYKGEHFNGDRAVEYGALTESI